MKSCTIVYLDQNYLSNLAKARFGMIKDETIATFWRNFYDDLQKAVDNNLIRTPMSEFHEIETSLNTKIEKSIKDTLSQLSIEFQFKDSNSILEWQISDAIVQFRGMKLVQSHHPIFNYDPNVTVKDRLVDAITKRGTVSLNSYLVADPVYIRKLKVHSANWINHSLEKWTDTNECTANSILASKLDWLSNSLTNDLDMWTQIIEDIKRLGIQESVINDFWTTGKLLDIPFIDIFSSLVAILCRKYKNSGPNVKESDLFDIPILATVIPYCNIVTTDKAMKKLVVDELKCDKIYNAEIYSCTKRDSIALHNKIRQLLDINQTQY